MFCNPRTSGKQRQFSRELLRLCFLDGVRVRGGASRLIKAFISETNPYDLFTYQATDGEVTDVYRNSGMSLIGSPNPEKQVLVLDGLTYAEATDNRRDWFSLNQAVTRGPDALLGTSLGQGTGRSNVELFLEIGYHLETIPGDRVYGWHNPNWTHYVYRITSSADAGYYIGRRSIPVPDADESDCIRDGYLGSGGFKFQAWVADVATATLRKSVLGVYRTRAESIDAEERLVGDLYRTDQNCRNSIAGGLGYAGVGGSGPIYVIGECTVHGMTKFQGGCCARCRTERTISVMTCPLHGETKHVGDRCMRCNIEASVSVRACPVHGADATFMGESCIRCSVGQAVSIRECPEHGLTTFQGDVCATCSAQATWSVRECAVHGASNFIGGSCATCSAQASITVQICSVHGETKFKGDSCRKCSAQDSVREAVCTEHGLTVFRGDTCQKCMNQSSLSVRVCQVHGEVTFRGDTCMTCSSHSTMVVGVCHIHGETRFRKASGCVTCTGERSAHTRWHVNRDLVDPECRFCQTGSDRLSDAFAEDVVVS